MDSIEVVKVALAAWERNDAPGAAAYLTEDFTFSGPVPVPLNREQYARLSTALMNACPDWKFNVQSIAQEGDRVVATVRITGTQTGTLENVIPGVPPIPPTGKSFAIPEEQITFTFRGDQIANISVNRVPGGGVPGIYAQIGHPLPVPQGASQPGSTQP